MKYNYVVFATYANLYRYMYQDLENQENVQVYWDRSDLLELLPQMAGRLAKLHTNSPLPMKKLWYFWASNKIRFENGKPICFVWHHHFIEEIEGGMINHIRKMLPESKHIYLYTDSWRINEDSISFLKTQMDAIAVFDPVIAEKHHFIFLPNIYPDIECQETAIDYDICFVGQDKGREKELESIAELCAQNNIRTAFYIGKSQNKNERGGGIRYMSGKMAYKDVVDIVKRSNCVLELKVEPDNTCSLRVQEAVTCGKKLITNNLNVYKMPCCRDSEWIHYFSKPEDIDWEFIKRVDKVDYHYNGEYSAQTWLQRIDDKI